MALRPGGRFARRSERGAAAVEFALVSPLLLALLFGIVDGGRVFMADQDAATAAREGARYALSGDRYGDCAGIVAAATRLAIRSKITSVDVTVQYDHGPGTTPFATCPTSAATLVTGDRIVVTARRTVNPTFPPLGAITVSSVERRTVLKKATS